MDEGSTDAAGFCHRRQASHPCPIQGHPRSRCDHGVWQNVEEHRFLRRLTQALAAANQRAIFVCDRGFHRAVWIYHLAHTRHGFLVRIRENLAVQRDQEQPILLHDLALRPGQHVDLSRRWLREDKAARARIVGIWEAGRVQPWWLATNLAHPVQRIAALYAKRMDIEEQIRDVKGCRFGFRMRWTQHRHPAYLERLVLLIAIALVILSVVGVAKTRQDPSARLPSKTKGPRLSMPEVGIIYLTQFHRRITTHFVRANRQPPTIKPCQETYQVLARN
ncbi:transposase [Candidatus Poribacteria bacterium]|nr:transposase [Candidatus Poribacteria bacterium]